MLVPSIFFPSTCAEAHELYKKAFGMKVHNIAYYDQVPLDYHDEPLNENTKKLITHSECSIYGVRINMCDDTEASAAYGSFNIFLPSEDEVLKVFEVLKDGGTVENEPQAVFWSSIWCTLKDRFGVDWQIMTE